ncbi:copper transporter [Haloechinothrix salitolerans]|uniref:Copper transporter n=1 Tax=Haloechinothrix salitolerans TaxID=926830 RepID=A0ABW2C1U8_9PSEU
MISLRYHIISIAAVFLALAVGVVLGSTTLSGTLLSSLSNEKSELANQVTDLEAERNGLEARLADADAFAGAVGPKVVSGLLDKRTVLVVTTEGVAPSERDGVVTLIEDAGGTVSGEIKLTEAFTDPSESEQVSDIAIRLQPAGAKFPTSGGPGALAGALLGETLLLDGESAKPQTSSGEREAAVSGLTDGGFIEVTDDVRPAQLAVVLVGDRAQGTGAGDKAVTLARFATQLDKAGAGAVLAGRTSAAGASGSIGVVRADTAASDILSTVDNVDTQAGRVTTVLALREQLEDGTGRYGTAGNAEAPAPGVRASGR